mgnify:CR=1 FL=1
MKRNLFLVAVSVLVAASAVVAHQNPPGFEGSAVPAVHFPLYGAVVVRIIAR